MKWFLLAALVAMLMGAHTARAETYDEGAAKMAMKMAGVTDCTIKSGKPPGLGVDGMIVQCTDDRVFAVLAQGANQVSVLRYDPVTSALVRCDRRCATRQPEPATEGCAGSRRQRAISFG